MGIKYLQDEDLMFLKYADNDDLEFLLKILVYDTDGKKRITEELTNEERFIFCKGNYQEIWDLIAGELQLFGGDTMANVIRGHGVRYREILTDVCDQLKVEYNKDDEIVAIENALLLKFIEKAMEQMSEKELREFSKEMGLNIINYTPIVVMTALQVAIKSSGFLAYKLSVVIANTVVKTLLGRGLALTVNATLTRGLAIFAGPIGWAITTLLTIPVITGPAYRVTIPACVLVAYTRKKQLNRELF